MVDDSYFPPSPVSNAFSTHMMSNYEPHSGSNSNTLETQTKKISEKVFHLRAFRSFNCRLSGHSVVIKLRFSTMTDSGRKKGNRTRESYTMRYKNSSKNVH